MNVIEYSTSKKSAKAVFIQISWNALRDIENPMKTTRVRYERLMPNDNDKRFATAAMSKELYTVVEKSDADD